MASKLDIKFVVSDEALNRARKLLSKEIAKKIYNDPEFRKKLTEVNN